MNTDKQTIQETEIKEEMMFLLGSPIGRRFLSRMFSETGIYRISYTPNDNQGTAFAEGQRNIGLMLFNRALSADPKTFCMNMIGE